MLGSFGFVDYGASSSIAALYIFFTLFINVVLLNFLIAIIGDTYEKELEKKLDAATLELAVLLCEIEDVDLSAAELSNPDYFPAFLHVLKVRMRVRVRRQL